MAVLASKAWMPRKSSFSASGGVVQVCQVVPSSVVRRTVPAVPLAHAIPLPRAWMPRRLAVVWDRWMVHWACAVVARTNRIRAWRMGKDSVLVPRSGLWRTGRKNKQRQRQKQVLRLRRRMTTKNNGNGEMRGSLHCGGKVAAFGRDDGFGVASAMPLVEMTVCVGC